jgi:hypothetical protein
MKNLENDWIEAKEAERAAVERRRLIEDKILAQVGASNDEGTRTIKVRGEQAYEIKLVTRFTRKVDSDLLQEIAAENNLTSYLPTLFRWKPELNAKAWDKASSEITKPLSGAITTTPGRPSFTITKE